MPQKVITQDVLDQALTTFREELKLVFATKQDLIDVEERMTKKLSQLQSSVDRYLKKTETWYLEQVVLKFQHERLEKSLIRKNIVTEKEIHS